MFRCLYEYRGVWLPFATSLFDFFCRSELLRAAAASAEGIVRSSPLLLGLGWMQHDEELVCVYSLLFVGYTDWPRQMHSNIQETSPALSPLFSRIPCSFSCSVLFLVFFVVSVLVLSGAISLFSCYLVLSRCSRALSGALSVSCSRALSQARSCVCFLMFHVLFAVLFLVFFLVFFPVPVLGHLVTGFCQELQFCFIRFVHLPV